MSDSVQPHRRQPTRLPHPRDSPGKNAGVGYHFLLQWMKRKVKVKLLSHVLLLVTTWTAAYQAPPPMGFPGKNTGMGCHFPLQGIFLTQGWNPHLLNWQAGSLPLSHQGSPKHFLLAYKRRIIQLLVRCAGSGPVSA